MYTSFGINDRKILLKNNDISDISIYKIYRDFLIRCIETCKNFSSKISMHELMQYSASKLLVDGDVMSMSQGLEFRFPFLDIDLVSDVLSFKNNINSFSKYNKDKIIIRESIKDFPNHLMMRKKMGFTLPITDFIKIEIDKNFNEINSV